jgi:N-acetyl-gamma-glutamyl-phosphate reductase
MAHQVFIDGEAGTTGLQIRERLAARSDIELILLGEARRKDLSAREEALNAADAVILCLPDEAAKEAVALVRNPKVKVIDASSAHRVAEGWTYGFPELRAGQREAIAKATRISNPGCYPTGFLGLMAPLVRAGLVAREFPEAARASSPSSRTRARQTPRAPTATR